MTLHVVTFISVGAIIAALASAPNGNAVPNEAPPVQEGRVGKGEGRVEILYLLELNSNLATSTLLGVPSFARF